MNQTRFTLRIHPLIMKKLKVIADHNGRSVNKEIEQILKWITDDFENKCGKIRTEELDLIDHPEKKLKSSLLKTARWICFLNCKSTN